MTTIWRIDCSIEIGVMREMKGDSLKDEGDGHPLHTLLY